MTDVRFPRRTDQGRHEYETGHIPGAVFVDVHTELAARVAAAAVTRCRAPTSSRRCSAGWASPRRRFVVAYDSAGGAMASRLWWMLRSIGHGQVAVLDGGYQAWVAGRGHTLRHVIETRPPANYPRTGRLDRHRRERRRRRGRRPRCHDRSTPRAPERFRGEVEPLDSPRRPHPGSDQPLPRRQPRHVGQAPVVAGTGGAGWRASARARSCTAGVASRHATRCWRCHWSAYHGRGCIPGRGASGPAIPRRPIATGDD